jgi:hypothetical protein
MFVAEQAVEDFLGSVKRAAYSRIGGRVPEDLAELLYLWLVLGDGVLELGESYENFLQMVIILLTGPRFKRGIDFLVLSGGHQETQTLKIPKTADWVKKVGKDAFLRARKNCLRALKEERG